MVSINLTFSLNTLPSPCHLSADSVIRQLKHALLYLLITGTADHSPLLNTTVLGIALYYHVAIFAYMYVLPYQIMSFLRVRIIYQNSHTSGELTSGF